MAGKFRLVAIVVVVFGLALGVVFGLGVKYGQGKEPEAQQGVTLQQIQQLVSGGGGGAGAGAAGAGAGGAGAGGAGAGGAATGGAGATSANNGSALAAGRATAGKITAVQGQTVTIELRPGVTQKINLAAQSVVNKTATGAGADLKEGSQVVITGTRKDDGSFDAATINLVAPELAQVLSAPATTGTTPAAPAATTPAAPSAPAPAAPAPGR